MSIARLESLNRVDEHREGFFVAWCSIEVLDRRGPNPVVDDIEGIVDKSFSRFKAAQLSTGRFRNASRLNERNRRDVYLVL